MTVEIRDDRFREVVGDAVEIEQLGTGFTFTDGPVWHPYEKHLIFSDMPGDHMRRWSTGRPSTSAAATPGLAKSSASELTYPAKPAGASGATPSARVSPATVRPAT